MDVRTMINTFMAEQLVYVARFSYGTFVVQRVLQLQVPQVKGYIFDGVDALSIQGDAIETANSHWNKIVQALGRRLLEFCFDDPTCPIQFKSRETVVADALAVLAALDKNKNTNECAQIVVNSTHENVPLVGLRSWMFPRVGDAEERKKALRALGLVQHCPKENAEALRELLAKDDNEEEELEEEEEDDEEEEQKNACTYKSFQGPIKSNEEATHANVRDPLDESSVLLYALIVSSERWATPAPTKKERAEFVQDSLFALDDSAQVLQYCVFTGSTEPACQELQDELPKNRSATFFYKHDTYYDAPLTLLDHANAFIFSGGLDFATPQECGELLYSKLKGSGKGVMMVSFDYGTHCRGEAVAGSTETPCLDAITAAFIQNDDSVANIDTTCMDNLLKASFGALDK